MPDDSVTLAFYILYGFAYFASIIGFMMTNILMLRIMVIVSSHLARKLSSGAQA
jgi:hypothetical protein